ncbi:MAG: hypothetical protein ACR2HG_11445 [Pyrinomonadaceae bacterium]
MIRLIVSCGANIFRWHRKTNARRVETEQVGQRKHTTENSILPQLRAIFGFRRE